MEEIFSKEPKSPEWWTAWPRQGLYHSDDADGMEEKYAKFHVEEDSMIWASGW